MTESGIAFPLHTSTGKRYLVNSAGKPFFLNGDASWSLIAQLSNEDADFYLRDRKARGFNTVLVNLLEHRFATNAPANIQGEQPFTVKGDFATPNEAYFKHADRILRRACELGLMVLLAPSYTGNGGGPEGWYQEMSRSGVDKLRAYGRFVGARYRNLPNIVWVQGGDYNPPDKALVRAVASGIAETDPEALQTAHAGPGTAALDYWGGESWLQINNVYTYEPVLEAARGQFARHAMPFFLMESSYENEHGTSAEGVRGEAYQAVLSGAFGQVYGNNPMWHFDGPGLFRAPDDWKAQLDSPGARSMTVLESVISSVKWWLLQPDMDHSLLLEGAESSRWPAVAARATDGSFAMVYVPDGRKLWLDLSKIAGSGVLARWIDPTSGHASQLGGSPFVRKRIAVTPPPRNKAGSTDWILQLSAQPSKAVVQ